MIDKLTKLFNDGDIETVIALSKNSNDPKVQFFYLAALRYLGEFEIALSFISEQQMKLYNEDAPRLIEWHIDILLELDYLDQALNTLKMYEDFPYFSLETNELIASLGEKVQHKRKLKTMQKNFDLYEIERRLFSRSAELAYSALNYINNNYHEAYVPILKKALLDAPDENTKSLVVFALKNKNFNEVVQVNKFGKLVKCNPALAPDPFATKAWEALSNKMIAISNDDEDMNFGSVASSLMLGHAIYLYPIIYANNDIDGLASAYHFMTLRALGRGRNLIDFANEFNYDLNKIEATLNKYHFDYFRK
ncbi:MAG: hypothetical protein BWY30_00116 [Tenericutes bacterium ADurb.Bin239]|nr:MAG: hypothetical protein BWY30_00116 [Tenericutes bacterium ADurb.Bin239]